MTPADTSRAVIITGMHRSGTSLAASLLQRGGVHIGSRLIEADTGNPRGYYEDKDFVRFHDDLLSRSDQRVFVQDDSYRTVVLDEDKKRALELVNQKSGRDLWGWKDPRTSLFLNFWSKLISEVRFIFMIRHPIDVVLSLMRRGFDTELEVLVDPLAGLRAWVLYNQPILSFLRRSSANWLVCNVYSMTENPSSFLAAASEKLRLPLRTEGLDDLVGIESLQPTFSSVQVDTILDRVMPEALKVYRELESLAVLSELAPGSHTKSQNFDPRLETLVHLLPAEGSDGALTRPLVAAALAILNPSPIGLSGQSLRSRLSKVEDSLTSLQAHCDNLEALRAHNSEVLEELRRHISNLEGATGKLGQSGIGSQKELERLETLSKNLSNLEIDRKRNQQHIEVLTKRKDDLHASLKESQRQAATDQRELQSRGDKHRYVQSRLAEQNEWVADAEKQLRLGERVRREDRKRIDLLESSLAMQLKHVEACDQELGSKRQDIHSLQSALTVSTRDLEKIHTSLVWRLAEFIWRSIDRILPPQSSRRRTYDRLMHRMKSKS